MLSALSKALGGERLKETSRSGTDDAKSPAAGDEGAISTGPDSAGGAEGLPWRVNLWMMMMRSNKMRICIQFYVLCCFLPKCTMV